MKTRYLKGMMIAGFGATLLFFSSCLKDDKHYFNAETVPSLAELPLSGLNNFSKDAITVAGIDTITYAVGVTDANPVSSPVTVTLAVDNTIVTSYNAANTAIVYQPFPTAAFKMASTTVTIPAGSNTVLTTVIIDRTTLDPAVSYMLPIKVASAGGRPISADYGVHYFHVIGNDFAGTYRWSFERWSGTSDTTNAAAFYGASFAFSAGNTMTLSPVSPTELTAYTGYDGGNAIRYDITFTKTVTGGVASYTNFAVTLLAADVADVASVPITFPQYPVFVSPTGTTLTATLPGPYTFAQAVKLFHFQFVAMTSATRYIVDNYQK